MSLATQIDSLATRVATEFNTVRSEIASLGSSLSYFEVNATSNLTMTTANTFYNGLSLSLGAGTYLINASITVSSANATAQRVTAKLWNNSTTVWASTEAAAPSQGTGTAGYLNLFLTNVIVLTGTTTVYVGATSTAGNSVFRATVGDNSTNATNTASNLVAVKIA